ncbi:MAG: hypothetical protein M3Q39_10025 [Actinomycetota bacterium]|nr:hypothetical protein [Actinomycetota bacterium]
MPQIQNNYKKAEKYIAAIVGALARDTVLPMTFTRYDGRGFVGAQNDTVTVKLPGVTVARDYEWRTRNNPIVLDLIGRTHVDIKLNQHTTSAVPITDEEDTLDLTDYATEILTPQANAMVEKLERKTLAGLLAAPFKHVGGPIDAAEEDDPFKYALKVGGLLDQDGVPGTGRRIVAGSNAYAWFVESAALQKSDPAAATTAYRQAVPGRLANFDIVNGGRFVDPNAIYPVHSTALILANLAPSIQPGVVWAVRRAYKGYSMRLVRDYDQPFARGRSLLSTFTGVNSVNDEYTYDADGYFVLDADGNPVITGKNVRGARGTFTPTPPPAPTP